MRPGGGRGAPEYTAVDRRAPCFRAGGGAPILAGMPLPPHGPDEVRRIAALARLRLTDAEAAALSKDFAATLEYVDRLRARDDADAAEPLVHAVPTKDPAGTLRADEPAPAGPAAPLPRETVLGLAPDRSGPLVRVPRVLEEGR